MKKKDLATLAVLGISAGLLMGGCQEAHNGKNKSNTAAAEQLSPDMQSFYNSLSSDNQRKFLEMDAQHRMMAMEMAHQSCKGQNSCKGLGGCQTSDHSCAGKNGCKGQGGPAIQDPNKAVDVIHQNQMQGRSQMQRGMYK